MILIVDDKPENLFSLRRTLELNGFEADSAGSGEEALRKILNADYSLIILDVQMPGMDGFEVAETLSGFNKAKDIPIIFLSAVNTDKKFITKGYSSGGVDYITKPVDPEILMLRVKTLIRLYDQHRELTALSESLKAEVETRKEAEERLKKNMEEQLFILESMPQIAFTVLPDCSIEFVNERWFAYSAAKDVFPETHPDDKDIYESLERDLDEGKVCIAELRILHRESNTYRYHLLKMVPVRQEGQIVKWVGTFTDIQEQKKANEILEQKVEQRTEELQQKNKELETSNHELQQFASVASHDLKEPLRKVQIYSSVIRERFLNGTPEAQVNIDRVVHASSRMSRLIDDLLHYSRLSMSAQFERTDLNELVTEILYDLEFPIREKNAHIELEKLPVLEVIPGQIRQVFQNLISNALKFSRRDVPPQIHIGATTVEEDGQRKCRIEVRDNGIGFNEQYLDKIFTIFQRLNGKDEYEGTGIGLAIVKKIVEKHNGSITAKSIEGAGSTFILTLPFQQIAPPKQTT